ncbi:uncharacterized protein LOC112056320 [Bicyclus anynana]|uniref:Uncharacterized protein LOC112056320 n=1 Tax=Bicyclus anynana TaxID=110368 RepID=A0ABM3LYH2_BICAN|nr:uncharacterized protein LOC112056320 [Bicyclus anynana]
MTSNSNTSTTSNTKRKLVGILKHNQRESSDDDDDEEEESMSQQVYRSQPRCLVGQVPRPPGTKPGRGGGVAFLVSRKNVNNFQAKSSTTSTKSRKSRKQTSRKPSYYSYN